MNEVIKNALAEIENLSLEKKAILTVITRFTNKKKRTGRKSNTFVE